MKCSPNMENLNIGGAELLKWNIGASAFLANPKDGARLMNWYLTFANGDVRDVIYWPENAPLGGENFSAVRGGIPILFPFAGNSSLDGKSGVWQTPDGEIRPMKRHGYASSGSFNLEIADDSGFSAKFLPSEDFLQAYPYDCEFYVRYRFEELMFSCELSLFNKSSAKIPWGAGLHPYFALPWKAGTERKHYRLLTDAKKFVRAEDSTALSPAEVKDLSFDSPNMHNLIVSKLKTPAVRFGPKNGEEDVCIQVGDGYNTPPGTCFVLWSESESAPYYCVEPWMSPPNSSKKPVHFVDPGKTKSFLVTIALA